jgi:O-antigen ligase
LILGLVLAVASALLIGTGAWYGAVALIFAVPVAVLMIRYPFISIMVWLLFVPYFLVAPGELRPIYYVLYRAIVPLAVGAAVLDRWVGGNGKAPLRLSRTELAIPAFLGLALVSAYAGSEGLGDFAQSAIQIYDRLVVPFCAYWVVRLAAPDERDLKRFLWVAFLTLFSQSIIGLVSWYAPELLPPQWRFENLGVRTMGTLRNPAIYTSTLVFAAVLLYQYAMTSGSRAMRGLFLAAFGLGILAVLFSFSRGSWLGCLLVLAGLVLLYPKPTLRVLIVLALVGGVLAVSLFGAEVGWAVQRLTSDKSEQNVENRAIGNNALLSMVNARPLLGWGYDSNQALMREFMRPVGDLVPVPRESYSSHNTYLTIAAELGILGLLLYMLPALWWLWASRRAGRYLPGTGFWSWRLLAVLWLSMLNMLVVGNFIDVISHHWFGTVLWWINLGLIANMISPGPNAGA